MILLDTHILIWFVEGNQRLRPAAFEKVAAAFESSEAGISAISFWEMAMLARKGRLPLAEPIGQWLGKLKAARNLHIEDVTWKIATAAGDLPDEIHGDPADRIIVATSHHHDWPLITADRAILDYANAGHVQAIDANL